MPLGKHDLYWGAFDYASHVPVLGRVICVCVCVCVRFNVGVCDCMYTV